MATLVHYFPFLSSSVADDVGGFAPTVVGSPTFVAGALSPWLTFPTTSDKVTMGTPAAATNLAVRLFGLRL